MRLAPWRFTASTPDVIRRRGRSARALGPRPWVRTVASVAAWVGLACVMPTFAQGLAPESSAAPASPSAARDVTDFTLVEGTLTASVDDAVAWSWPDLTSGGSATVVVGPTVGPYLLVGDGPYLAALRVSDGHVTGRWATPGTVTALDASTDPGDQSDDGSLRLRVTAGSSVPAVIELTVNLEDVTERLSVTGLERISFGTDVLDFTYLRSRALNAVTVAGDLSAFERRDPTDPWRAVVAATTDGADPASRDAAWVRAEAASLGLPFFETAALALAALDAGETGRYDRWMTRAALDMSQRGYDPRWLLDTDLRTAYGLPHDAFSAAVAAGDLERARTLAPWAWRTASIDAPETVEALDAFVAALRSERAFDEARLWQDRRRSLDSEGPAGWVDEGALVAGRWGYHGVAALVATFVACWLVLLAKVWRVETLLRRQRRERGLKSRAWTRVWVPRQVGTTEKLALLLLAAAIVVQTVLAAWSPHDRVLPRALVGGTWTGAEATAAIEGLPDGPVRDNLEGVAAAISGDAVAAEASFRRADTNANAWTNLGTLSGDSAAFERALEIDPRQPIARFALGRSDDPSPFHASVDPSAPMWAAPTRLALMQAAFGSWRDAVAGLVQRPWTTVVSTRPDGWAPAAWITVVVALAVPWTALAVSLVVPRARVARNAPRNAAYHVGSLAIPGSGHLDELWGVLLLVPWALVVADLWLSSTGVPSAFPSPAVAWGVLIGLYAVSTVGFVVEAFSYRHRMRVLREAQPELALSYGMRPLAPATRSDAA